MWWMSRNGDKSCARNYSLLTNLYTNLNNYLIRLKSMIVEKAVYVLHARQCIRDNIHKRSFSA